MLKLTVEPNRLCYNNHKLKRRSKQTGGLTTKTEGTMSVERDGAGIGLEQMPRSFLAKEDHYQQPVQREYISFNIGRWINTQVDEFADIRSYVHRLGSSNYEPEVVKLPDPQKTDLRPTRITNPEDIHIMSIYASDARELLFRTFGSSDGRFSRPDRVKQKVRSMQRRYKNELRQRNTLIQDAITYDLCTPEANPRRLPLDPRDLGHVALRMTNGIFNTKPSLKGFGDGRKFGVVFSPEAEKFLSEERAVSLDFVLSRLGIKHIDSDLEDRVLGRQHHATLIKKGGSDPYSLSYPTDGLGDILPIPSTIVTELDPKMRYIDASKQRAT